MGYMHIDNLYKCPQMLAFLKEVVAMEKIHGTSAHIKYKRDIPGLKFFSGGAKYNNFVALFNEQELRAKFDTLGFDSVTVYGEAYGGKLQGMSDTYGKDMKFVAFDVDTSSGGEEESKSWMPVDQAHKVCTDLGLEFVHYKVVPCTIEALDAERDADSVQAIRNGCGPGHIREGVVVKPVVDIYLPSGKRVIAKHKRTEFKETNKDKVVDLNRVAEIQAADAAADDWVTETRLDHVIDKLVAAGVEIKIENTPDVIRAMVDDVQRESDGIIVWSKDVARAVGSKSRKMFMKRIATIKNPSNG